MLDIDEVWHISVGFGIHCVLYKNFDLSFQTKKYFQCQNFSENNIQYVHIAP